MRIINRIEDKDIRTAARVEKQIAMITQSGPYYTYLPSNDNFLVGADLCVRPDETAHAGAPLQFQNF